MFKLIKQNKFVSILLSVALASSLGWFGVKFKADMDEQDIISSNNEIVQLWEEPDLPIATLIDDTTLQYDNSNFLKVKENNPDLVGILECDLFTTNNHALQIMQDDIKNPVHLDDSLFGDISNVGTPGALSVVGGHNTTPFLGPMAENPGQADKLHLYTEDNAYELDLIAVRKDTTLNTGQMDPSQMKEYASWLKANADMATNYEISDDSSIVSVYCCVPGTSGRTNPERMVFEYSATALYKQMNQTSELGRSIG